MTEIGSVYALAHEFLSEYIDASCLYQGRQDEMSKRDTKERLQNLITNWISKGYVILAYDSELQPQGVIIAERENNFWLPDIRIMREIIWYVRPAYRRSRLSAELFLQFQADIENFKSRGLVDCASLTLPAELKDFDLSKRGWQNVETHWIKG